MNFFKKQLPLLLGMAVGLVIVADFYISKSGLHAVKEQFITFGQILASAAFVLGAINLFEVNWPKIRRREPDWLYKVVLLAGAIFTFGVGLSWQALWHPTNGRLELRNGGAQVAGGNAALEVHSARPEAVVNVDGGPPQRAVTDGKPLTVELPPGKHTVKVTMPAPVTGYGELEESFTAEPGQTWVATAHLPLMFGQNGRIYTWMYAHVYAPCSATMFALLAFFIASAAFRAFRARNTEAGLLLGSAIIVLLGRAPIGRFIHHSLPDITNWIIDIPNNAGRRAIMMGAALGGIVTGLRIILGLERSHLGSE